MPPALVEIGSLKPQPPRGPCGQHPEGAAEHWPGTSLDDFGTGSSLYLRRLPLSALKIDQSFAHGMMNDAGDLAIVQGVIVQHARLATASLPKAWKPPTRARCCCNWAAMAQGYHFARPSAGGRFHPMGQNWQAPAWRTAHIRAESI